MHRPFSAEDSWHLSNGSHSRLWEVLGSHVVPGQPTAFRVWAPDATEVCVISEANEWKHGVHALEPDPSGVWRGEFAGYEPGVRYKYSIMSRHGGERREKADPLARLAEVPPATASVVATDDYQWSDQDWMDSRGIRHRHDSPLSIYEVHLGSWRYEPGGYRSMGEQLAEYCTDLGFTHVELLPVTEHPFYGSWGYQTTGYFAPTSRYGGPEDLKAMVDTLHQAGVGVILDWVPSHFPVDAHSLGEFDGSHLYEHADPRQGFHPDWKSWVFNYDRPEVRSFLVSSANFWMEAFHLDGLRVDAVASMLYLDYSRADGEWIPNIHGGNENLGAIQFLQTLNETIYREHPGAIMIAEESTAWPGVTNPVEGGGLGFGLKWDMGWMNDTLVYFRQEPVHRRWHHDTLTFRSVYASAEHYVLPLSHDEVVHGKRSLLEQMPGDDWQKFANLRLLLGYQWTAPGKNLLFMGSEFAVRDEWNHEQELNWSLLGEGLHAGVQGWVRKLNGVYRANPALYRADRDPSGFRWVVGDDSEQSVVVFARFAPDSPPIVVAMNNTPVPRAHYRIGIPAAGRWEVVANSDDPGYGGSGVGPSNPVVSEPQASHGYDHSVEIVLPPLGMVILAPQP